MNTFLFTPQYRSMTLQHVINKKLWHSTVSGGYAAGKPLLPLGFKILNKIE